MSKKDWKALCLDKQERRRDAIPKDWLVAQLPPEDQLNVSKFPRESGLLTVVDLQITESSVETLLANLASAVWSSVDVTLAFYKRAILAHQLVNCLTEIFVEKALQRARDVDAYLERTGTLMGPLHGLPVSLKDQAAIKGLETTMGYVSWIGRYADHDAAIVEILYELGAIPFVRTNIPQSLMWLETFNHVFGRTLNPFNRSLTPGGSSGGEGALIGFHGSPLGIGSDSDSIRVPAAFNGLYGFRPSYHRLPYRGLVNSLEGQESIPSVIGPISESSFGIKLFMKAVIDAKPWLKDPLVTRKRWDQESYELVDHGNGRQLVFAIIWNDGRVVPNPPIHRALDLTRKALIAAGHKVVDWKPHKHTDLCDMAREIWKAGLKEDVSAIVSGCNEPIILTMSPDPNDPTVPLNVDIPTLSAYELWQLQKQKRDLRTEYLDHWEATVTATGTDRPVDAIIAPVAPTAAPPHGKFLDANYTVVWNVLDFPSFVFPVTTVDPILDARKPAHEFLSETDKAIYELYAPETFKDAPVGLQLVGRTQEDEAVIGMGEIVDLALKSYMTKDDQKATAV